MNTIWRNVKAILSGIAFAFIALLIYAVSHNAMHRPHQAVEATGIWTVYSPWFWLFVCSGFALGVYSVLKAKAPAMRIVKTVFFSLVFTIVGFVVYIASQINYGHDPGHAVATLVWRPHSPWLWFSVILGCIFGAWLGLRKNAAAS